jgi:hypothetical protein
MEEISEDGPTEVVYSFCTLVTRLDEYKQMVGLFEQKGFTRSDCEYLYIDNSKSNKFDAFSGYNRFLQRSRGQYVVLCHQDIEPIEDDRAKLDYLLEELNSTRQDWGLCGNAGADWSDDLVVRITDPWGADRNQGGPFPAPVMSLDENFILVRRDANLVLSRDLKGFHWYGADICINADIFRLANLRYRFSSKAQKRRQPRSAFL